MEPAAFSEPRDFARLAIEFLESHGISADPRTFTLGYTYFAGTHPAVKVEIDHLIAAGAFNRRSCARLYEEVFGLDAEARAIRDASETIERSLARVLGVLDDAGKDAQSYGQALENATGMMANASDMNALRSALEGILSETRRMESRSTTLHTRFADATEEVAELRRNLDEMRLAASTDGLTGIPNRKSFDLQIREFCTDAERAEAPLSLLMADVDHFKKFNDDHGHQVGDLVLKLVARTLSDCVRGRDFVARYGGEEFVVLLPRTGVAGAFAVAENIRDTIAAKRFAKKSTGESLGTVTLSFGVAQYKPGETLEDFVARADTGLYQAKKRGRNRVESTEPTAGSVRRVGARA